MPVKQRKYRLSPLRIASIYALTGGLWIVFSDTILAALVADKGVITRISICKGWAYVIVTALLLYWLVRRYAAGQREIMRGKSESKYYNRALFEHSPIGLALCRMDGKLVDINPAFARILGRTVDETLELSYWDITPEKYADQEAIQLESLKTKGKYGPYEKEYIHKNGHLVHVRLLGRIIEEGGEKLIWSSVEDITESRKAEAALRRSEEKYAKTFRGSPDAIMLTSLPSEQFVEVNDRFIDISGYSLDQVTGHTSLELNLWENASDRRRFFEQLRTHGSARNMETGFRTKSGDILTCIISGETINLQGGKYILSVIRDITERRKAEEERQLFFSLANNSKEFIGIADLNFTPFYANAAALDLVGLPDIEAVRQIKVQDLFFPEDQPFITHEFLPRVLREGNGEVEIRLRNVKTGEAIWMLYNVFTVNDMRGKPAGWATVSRNITRRKKAELELERHRNHLEELVKDRTSALQKSQQALMNLVEDLNLKTKELETANDKLKELDRLKSMFIASMSHELRTPLNSIIGFSSIIQEEWVGPVNREQKENLSTILRAGKHLLSLINDVIDVSKIEAGRIDTLPEDFDLHGVIREAADLLKRDADEKGLTLTAESAHVNLHTDRRRLMQCVTNLLSNAVKFTEKGSVRITAHPAGAHAAIAVRDTGIGIRKEEIARLFTAFARLESPLKAKVPGTGLGLYLTKKIVTEVLKGNILAASTYGEGSVFTLLVPIPTGATHEESAGNRGQ